MNKKGKVKKVLKIIGIILGFGLYLTIAIILAIFMDCPDLFEPILEVIHGVVKKDKDSDNSTDDDTEAQEENTPKE